MLDYVSLCTDLMLHVPFCCTARREQGLRRTASHRTKGPWAKSCIHQAWLTIAAN